MASPGQLARASQLPLVTALLQLVLSLPSSTVSERAIRMLEIVKNALLGRHLGWNSVGRVFLWALLVANARALPFVWHVRVFRPLIYVRFEQLFIMAKCMFSSKKTKQRVMEEWIESISPVGRSPLGQYVVYQSIASFDECDYNLHLSNSSYAKALDGARFKLARELFTQFLRVGGHMPLAATHFHFIKEIPVMSRYEVRVSLGSWDEKWAYILCRFLTKKKPGQEKSSKTARKSPEASTTPSMFNHAPISDSGTPSLSSSTTPNPTIVVDTSPEQTVRTLASKLASQQTDDEEEGYTLHTVTVSLMCFKIGRITVPPTLVMAASGLCAPPPSPPLSASPESVDSLPNPFSPPTTVPPNLSLSTHDKSTNPVVTLSAPSPLSPSEPPKGTTTEVAVPSPTSPNYTPVSPASKWRFQGGGGGGAAVTNGDAIQKQTPVIETYSHTNPPPHWKWVLKTISAPHGGSVKSMSRLMKGVWKNIPSGPVGVGVGRPGGEVEVGEHVWYGEYQGGRWWERALEGLEEERKERLVILEGLKIAMSGVRDMK
ncbi:hypothetical protein VKT23_009812 [Stygiomarasmius scandens]|uniref:Uncharacterized protein n=1 Tax=Marasmiellus scandens TaxID=2682957 RepID=A0ABR1JIN6_9AGAR